MLRTQEAAEFGIGAEGIGLLCEAMCFDAIEVASATRASVWFFDNKGNMVCHRLVDARDSRIQQGAVIPRAAAEPYFKAAIEGLASITSDDTVPQDGEGEGEGAAERTRLDLLLIDGRKTPAAVFRAERLSSAEDWSERDLKILRELAQALAWAIRKQCQRDAEARGGQRRGEPAEIVSARPLTGNQARAWREMGSTVPNISWLRSDPVNDIRLPQPGPASDQARSGDQDKLAALLSEDDGWEC